MAPNPRSKRKKINPKPAKKSSLIAAALCVLQAMQMKAIAPRIQMATIAVITMPPVSDSIVSFIIWGSIKILNVCDGP